jgi:autotransporter-associated beta strand protein
MGVVLFRQRRGIGGVRWCPRAIWPASACFAAALIVAIVTMLAPVAPALADCHPDPAVSGDTVTCTGTAHNGFHAGGGVDKLKVDVTTGATLSDNGGVVLGLKNANTVDNHGQIISRPGAKGIEAINNNTISNFSNMQVGAGGVGVFASDLNNVRNIGTINLGNDAAAIDLGNNNSVTNSGAINGGTHTLGIDITNNSTAVNNGTIVLGDAKHGPTIGISAGSRSSVTNNGGIDVGKGGFGIEATGLKNTLTNNGTITSGVNGVGIFAGSASGPNDVINTGSVAVSGRFGDAILVQNSGTVFNSGTLSAPGGTAIDFCVCSTGYTLTLAPTSVIDGLVTATGNDKLQLGGTGTGKFDLTAIGKQYTGFGVFNVIGGTWILTGTGNQDWTIKSGTLQLGNGGTSGALTGNVVDHATFAIDRSNTFTFGGTISGDGSFEQLGSGTTVLAGNNTYTGGTNVVAGTLKLGGAGSLGANTGTLVVSGGTLDLGGKTQGTGALTLSGGFIQNGTLTSSFFGVQAGTISAALDGAGALTKTGNGTVILSGTDRYTGATTVNGGTLEVDGVITHTSALTVNAGGTLAGSGTIDPLTVMIGPGATFAPGTPSVPGTSTTIVGNLKFGPGAIYAVNLDPASSTFAKVTGAASLTGAIVDSQFTLGSYVPKIYTILTTTGGLGGTTFAGLTSMNLPASFAESLSYSANDVYLNLAPGFTSFTGLTTNQQNVANTLTNFFNTTGGIPSQFVTVTPGGLTQLDGEVGADGRIAAFQMMDQFLNLMLDPFVDGRLGSGNGLGGGRAMGFAPDEQASLPPEIALAYAGVLKAPPPAPFEQRWTTWGASYGGGNWTNGNAAVGSSNVAAQTYGVAAGMDYHYSPDTIFGFALGGGGTNWGLSAGGTGRSDAFQSGVYGITRSGPAYLAAAVSFANHWMTTNRGALGDALTANFDAQSYGGRVEGGYRYAVLPTLGLTPYAALQAQDFHTPGYTETDLNGGGVGLSYAAMNATDVRSELGARFDNPEVIGGMPILLRARLAWAHDWVSNPSLSAAFESLPGTNFIVNGAPLPQNSALTSAGAEFYITPRLTLVAKFDGEFAPGSQTYAGSGTLRYAW